MLSVVLAGCAEPEVEDDGEPELDPARASFLVQQNGTTLAPVDGMIDAAIDTALTFDGNGSTGAQGSFLWDFGDGDTAVGAVATHAFIDEGLYNVTLTVGAGNRTDTAGVLVNATLQLPDEPVLLATVPFAFSGSLPLANPNAAMNDGLDYADHTVTITAATDTGTAAIAREVRIHLEANGGAVATYLYWRSPDGTNLALSQTNSATQDIVFSEPMAAGDYVVRVRLFLGAAADYDITGEVDYFTS